MAWYTLSCTNQEEGGGCCCGLTLYPPVGMDFFTIFPLIMSVPSLSAPISFQTTTHPTPHNNNNNINIPLIGLTRPPRSQPLSYYQTDRSHIIKQIALACQHHGFFQVRNHGIPMSQINNMLIIAKQFFELPEGERLKAYSNDPLKTTRLSTSFNVRTEKVSNWRDFLRLHCYPLQDYVHEWPTNPPSFRKDVGEYCSSARGLALRLLEAISESLGLKEGNYIDQRTGKHGQHMAINYYPPCPQPDLTYGLPTHTDANLIPLLLQDHVPGLQVLTDGKWITINPIPNTFIVNIGDQMQVLSKDHYKSVLHRPIVNCDKERILIPTFYCPSPDAVIGPAQS